MKGKRDRKSKYTYEDIKLWIKNLGYELISKNYINTVLPIVIKDKENFYYEIPFNNIRKNQKLERFHKRNPFVIQNINLWCKLNDKLFELISEVYEGSTKKLQWKCLKESCGEIFEASWNEIQSGNNCSHCGGLKRGSLNCLATRNPELAEEWHPTLNGDLTPYNIMFGSHKKVWWQCSKNKNHVWETSVTNRFHNNAGCPYCAGFLPTEENNLLVNNPELCKEWDYNKNKKRPEEYTSHSSQEVWWICKDCENSWYASISCRNGTIKSNCPECNKSKGEKRISEIFSNKYFVRILQEEFEKLNNIDKANRNYYIPQKEFDRLVGLGGGNLSYDFYLPSYNLLIEYQGEQHEKPVDFKSEGKYISKKKFEKQIKHDNLKREYAKNHNINLLEIWYYDFDKIEEILDNYLKQLSQLQTPS